MRSLGIQRAGRATRHVRRRRPGGLARDRIRSLVLRVVRAVDGITGAALRAPFGRSDSRPSLLFKRIRLRVVWSANRVAGLRTDVADIAADASADRCPVRICRAPAGYAGAAAADVAPSAP